MLFRSRAPAGFAHIHEAIGEDELEAVAGGYKKAAGFDLEALNARPSLQPLGTAPGGGY